MQLLRGVFIIYFLSGSVIAFVDRPCFIDIDCQNNKPQYVQKNTQIPPVQKKHNLKYKGVGLGDFIALNMSDQSLPAVLKKVLPNWRINIDEALDDIQIDVVVQTSRKQAIIDIARALSARAKFYKYTSPSPTLTLLKI